MVALSTEIKYFTPKQTAVFLSISLFLVWFWMFIAARVDREDDRGFLTTFGIIMIMCFILAKFFSNGKGGQFLATLFYLSFGSFLVFLLTLTLGLLLSAVVSWAGFIVPITSTGLLMFFILRRLFSFPDNYVAFWVIISLPILVIITLQLLPFYDNIFAHDYGIGFPISIYLSLVFIAISVLCRERKSEIAEE
nr:hypothetical protein [uncultured Flavobacterium sp.]